MEQIKKEDIVDLLEPQEVKSLTQQYEANIQSKLNDWMTNCLEKEKVRKSGSPQKSGNKGKGYIQITKLGVAIPCAL